MGIRFTACTVCWVTLSIMQVIKAMLMAVSLFVWALPVSAEFSIAKYYMPNAGKVGEGRLRFMVWNVYDTTLYAPNGQFNTQEPFALSLRYLRSFSGEKIAERTVQEMQTQGVSDESQLSQWLEQMTLIFPDVIRGDAITGVYTADGNVMFYLNTQRIGEISDQTFAKRFFDIWLAENTREPSLRKSLLGLPRS